MKRIIFSVIVATIVFMFPGLTEASNTQGYCGAEHLTPSVDRSGKVCRYVMSQERDPKTGSCNTISGNPILKQRDDFCITSQQANVANEYCGQNQNCLIEKWRCLSRGGSLEDCKLPVDKVQLSQEEENQIANYCSSFRGVADSQDRCRASLIRCALNSDLNSCLAQNRPSNQSSDNYSVLPQIEQEVSDRCKTSFPDNQAACISDIKNCLSAEIDVNNASLEACLALYSRKQDSPPVPPTTSQDTESSIPSDIEPIQESGLTGGQISEPTKVVRVTINGQVVPLNNSRHRVRLSGQEGIPGRHSTLITIEYSNGDVDYLSYQFNYNPIPDQQDCQWIQDPYGECDWERQQVYDFSSQYCNGEFTGNIERFNYHFVDGQCGYTSPDSNCSWDNDPYGECDWNEQKVYEVEVNSCSGVRRRILGSERFVNGQCGYIAPSQPEPSNCPSAYPQCGGTTGLENYPSTDTIWVTPLCDRNGNITGYGKDNLGNRGECQ